MSEPLIWTPILLPGSENYRRTVYRHEPSGLVVPSVGPEPIHNWTPAAIEAFTTAKADGWEQVVPPLRGVVLRRGNRFASLKAWGKLTKHREFR